MRALASLNRLIRDTSNVFALYLLQVTPGYDFDAVARRTVAEAEAEGASLIGALPCPGAKVGVPHGIEWDGGREIVGPLLNPCPFCGAQE